MQGILKTFFIKKRSKSDPDSDLYDPAPNANPNFLTDPKKIRKLLKSIEKESPLCSIIVGDSNIEEFNSSILDILPEKKLLILDELSPSRGNERLISENKAKLSTTYNGIRLAFTLNDFKKGSSGGIAYYKTAIPGRIYYPQRRLSPRIPITSLNILFSGISKRTKATIIGPVFDLSREGVSVTAPNNITRLQRGDLLIDCHITIGGQTLDFDLTLRFVKNPTKVTGKTLMGGYFENLSFKSRDKLEHFVGSLQREKTKNRKT